MSIINEFRSKNRSLHDDVLVNKQSINNIISTSNIATDKLSQDNHILTLHVQKLYSHFHSLYRDYYNRHPEDAVKFQNGQIALTAVPS